MAHFSNRLGRTEEDILKALFPDKRLWYREFLNLDMDDKPLRRSLKRLRKIGYIVKDKPAGWKQGMKIHYYLTPEGKRTATQLIIGDKARELFIQVLERLESITKQPSDEGEKVLKPALEIINMLDDEEKSTQLKDALSDLISKLR